MATHPDLTIFVDEDGAPWLAFVWGAADPASVAALITVEAVEEASGFGLDELTASCSWPANVKAYWIREATEDDESLSGDFETTYLLCREGAPGAQRVTGHRFYYQG